MVYTIEEDSMGICRRMIDSFIKNQIKEFAREECEKTSVSVMVAENLLSNVVRGFI
jgi:hypothetical protein